eukprot:3939342-Rhodomonas_salina.1
MLYDVAVSDWSRITNHNLAVRLGGSITTSAAASGTRLPPPPPPPAQDTELADGWSAVWSQEYKKFYYAFSDGTTTTWDKPIKPAQGRTPPTPPLPPQALSRSPLPTAEALGRLQTAAGTPVKSACVLRAALPAKRSPAQELARLAKRTPGKEVMWCREISEVAKIDW